MQQVETLERLARLFNRDGAIPATIEPTGFTALDSILPGGGWRSGTVVELMPAEIGIGELRLLMPALARITRSGRHVAMIAPPYVPFAPALAQQGIQLSHLLIVNAGTPADILWSFEQILRCKSFGAAIAWPAQIKDREVRRLQLAAETGHNTGFLYRSCAAAREASPAAVRMKLRACGDELSIDVLKCRGSRAGMTVTVGDRLSAADDQKRELPCSSFPTLGCQPSTSKL
jgi:cell division inhibitor SulA/protein ImuA